MVKQSKDRMREYRARKKEAERKQAESTTEFLDQPFCDWLEASVRNRGDWDGAMISLNLAGLPPIEITDDSGPRPYEGIVEAHPVDPEDDLYAGYVGSVGRAENFIDRLLEAAHDAALVVSQYKQDCIQRRIAQIEARPLTDEQERKNALAEIVRLSRIRDQLEKQVKKTFPTWKVKGI